MQLRIENAGDADVTELILSEENLGELRAFAIVPAGGAIDCAVELDVRESSSYRFHVQYTDAEGWQGGADSEAVEITIAPDGVLPEGAKPSFIEFTGSSIKIGGSALFGVLMIAGCVTLVVLIVILAAGFSNRARFARCLPYIAFAALCCGILLSERDLGALLLYFLTTVLMYYVASSNGALCLAGLGMGAGAAVIAYNAMPYVQDRVAIWKNPWSDPLDAGYQIVHALIAIGSGGLFGMGLGLGMPRNVPLYHSDFIFTSIAEEFGLIFSIALMAVYVLIIMRGLIVAMNARTSFHSITAFGLVAMLGLQALLIIGGNTKLLPLTGVTLPLVSYGGSSLVSTFFSMGMLLGISSMNAEDEARDIEKIALREEVRP